MRSTCDNSDNEYGPVIVPVRATSYQHLRDAFMRSLRGRIQSERKDGTLSPTEEDVSAIFIRNSVVANQISWQALEEPLVVLRSAFPNTPLEKGTPLVVYSMPSAGDETRSLILEGLGRVDNTWISTQFFKAYFVGQGNSPAVERSLLLHYRPFAKAISIPQLFKSVQEALQNE